jgi:hypothetical protein
MVKRALAAVGLAAFLVGGWLAVSPALESDEADSSTTVTRTQPAPTPNPPSARVVAVKLKAVGGFDPEGDGRENDADAVRAVDGDTATAWSTERYQSFFKQGVGLVLDAGAVRRLERVTVATRAPGVVAEVRVGRARGGPFRTAAGRTPLAESTTFRLRGVRGRYVVIWITAIPGGGAGEVAEVTLRARAR